LTTRKLHPLKRVWDATKVPKRSRRHALAPLLSLLVFLPVDRASVRLSWVPCKSRSNRRVLADMVRTLFDCENVPRFPQRHGL